MSRQATVKNRHTPEIEHRHESEVVPLAVPDPRASNSCTVAEATKRWCPFARIREYQEGHMETTAVNRSFEGEDGAARGSLCLASGCMAWRWDISHAWDGEERRQEPRGYCGLAGKAITDD